MDSDSDRADVWVVEPPSISSQVGALCLQVLSPEEKQRMHRFHFEADRTAFLAAHALKRFALSTMQPEKSPGAWQFTTTSQGRPELVASVGSPRWRFNLSHTRTLVACIVTREIDCGIDVEQVRHTFDTTELSSLVLSTTESAAFATASEVERPQLFLSLLDSQGSLFESSRPRIAIAFESNLLRSPR